MLGIAAMAAVGAIAAPAHADGTPDPRASVDPAVAAHLQIRTSDGKGMISLDGVERGEGALSADVAPGRHTFAVVRSGYHPFDKTLTLAARDAWAETVTLQPIGAVEGQAHVSRGYEGLYGGFGLAGMFGIGGEGTELETNCDTLGAQSCDTGAPWGGGPFGYIGWTWNPVGFELLLGASFDQSKQVAHFEGKGGSGSTLPFTNPARDETFHFYRVGGMAALRVRASVQSRQLRATFAGGLGVSYKQMLMTRKATALDGTGREEAYSPDSVAYVSPAISLEAALQVRMSAGVSLAVGVEVWADNASIAGDNRVPPSPGHALVASGQSPAPIQTPEYHLATGPQAFIGPFLGMQFGP